MRLVQSWKIGRDAGSRFRIQAARTGVVQFGEVCPLHAEGSDPDLAKEWSCMSDCRITLVETEE